LQPRSGRSECCASAVMGWLENAKSMFADGGGLGCFPKIGRKLSKNSYAYPVDPGTVSCSVSRWGLD
jgi:hypothetical protein